MRVASIKDKNLVSKILVSAFAELKGENSINLVVKQDEKRIERMHVLMGYLFDRAYYFGEIFISDNNQACILLNFSSKEKVTLQSILWDVNLALNCIGVNRIFGVLKRQYVTNKYFPKEPHIKPVIMGVLEEYKGKGTAAKLMIEVKNRFRNSNLPVIVDAASEKNVVLYQKFGFKILKKDVSLDFPIYFMRLK